MSAEKNRPAGTGPAEILAGGSNTSIVSAEPAIPVEPTGLIGCTVEKPLDAALWRLRSGEIGLEDLTPGLAGFCTLSHADGYAAGFTAGVASVAVELRQAISDRDRYYRAAFAPMQPIKPGPSYAELEKRRHTFAGVAE
ncbi:hypothetical protein GY21_18960 [Cryobacterium roopkundense]|uniref:Uncharacterized protein n=1 Tax=Cryobacterium roopkundense TaxID=1001240 RepID=A0A099J0V7_9MICO|nr:hypothetical protein [Cryobacterium roopkundense]KGJ71901.1 hypothetical protein GY21_18960 [Cryobacterium roopkundense]MBB5641781.1 hypothetical protein [Cryobacterium roopkundense]